MTTPSRLLEELERTDESGIVAILKIIRQAQEFQTTQELHEKIVAGIHEIYRAYYHVSIFLADPGQQVLKLSAIAGVGAHSLLAQHPAGYSQPASAGICGLVLRTGRMYLSNDIASDPHFLPGMESQTKSELCLPIEDLRTCVGVLNIESDRIGTFSATDVYLFEVLAHAIGTSMTRDRITRELRAATGALNAMGSATPGAIAVLSPEGEIVFGNTRYLRYHDITGIVSTLRSDTKQRDGEQCRYTGRLESGEPITLSISVLANRGGYLVIRAEPLT